MAAAKSPLELFFENQICLVVEPSKAFLGSILGCLRLLDLPSTTQILSANKFDVAHKMIEDLKPKILITEYDIDGFNGLELVELQQRFHGDNARISMMISKNSSDSVIAEAAEEQVDTFLLKPFSADDFKKKLADVIQSKINPSDYTVKVREAHALMDTQDFEKALAALQDAKALNPKPALACYYAGETFRLKKDNAHALKEFQEGRKFQPLHYKCLTAEFEILVENKDYQKAYELIPILIKNFPLTPRRLTQVFIAAVYSLRFEYLSAYYEQLIKLEKKSPELLKVASAALFAGGKWYLQKKDLVQANSLFEKSFLTVNKDVLLMGRIINEFIKMDAKQDAVNFFNKTAPSDVGSLEYNRIAFRLDELTLNKNDFFEKARKFFLSGEADADAYKTIVRLFAENGKIPLAESAINKALASYPDLRDSLYQILEANAHIKNET